MTRLDSHLSARRVVRWRFMGWLGLYAAILLTIMVARFEVIDSPPFYDFAVGVWTEAIFLVETGFDYYALRYESGHTMGPEGGPRSYMTSVLPTIAAVMMVLAPSARASFVAYHIFIFACASGVLTLLYALLRCCVGRACAGLAVLAAATTPVFAVQIDMLGMEMPLIFCALLTTLSVARQRYGLAALAATMCFLMKPTGAIVTVATIVFVAARWILSDDREIRRVCRKGLLWNVAALIVQMLILRWGDCVPNLSHPASGHFFTMSWYWFPDLVVLLAAGSIVVGATTVYALTKSTGEASSGRLGEARRQCNAAIRHFPAIVYSTIVLVGVVLAVNVVFYIPRYFSLLVPFYYLVVPTLLWQWRSARFLTMVVLSGLVAFNALNWNGRFYESHLAAQTRIYGPLVGPRLAREGAHYERSHEYLREHRANIRGIRELEELNRDTPIVAGHPYVYFLALPRLGYVTKPLKGYAIMRFDNTQTTFQQVSRILDDLPRRAIFVSVDNGYYHGYAPFHVDLPGPKDEILYDDELPAPLLIYERQFRGSDDELRAEFIEHFWPAYRFPMGVRVRKLWQAGFEAQAVDCWQRPPLAAVRPLGRLPALAAMLYRLGRTAEAREAAFEFLQTYDSQDGMAIDRWLAFRSGAHEASFSSGRGTPVGNDCRVVDSDEHFERGFEQLSDNQFVEAGWSFFASLVCDWPELATLLDHLSIGISLLHAGELDAAYDQFDAARALEPRLAATHHWLGVTRRLQGFDAEAVEHLRRAVELQPLAPQFHLDLGIVLADQQQWSLAVDSFETAVRLEPASILAQRHLERAKLELRTPYHGRFWFGPRSLVCSREAFSAR